MNELNKKLLTFAGFTFGEYDACNAYQPVFYPDGKQVFIDPTLNFPESLDACLKYLFPKLVSDNKLWGHFVEFARWEGLPPSRKRLSDGKMIRRLLDPMFICQTIEKLIDGGQNVSRKTI